MEKTIKDLIDFLIITVKNETPQYNDEQCLKIATEIIKANFPICLTKYLRGDQWKL